MSIESSGIVMPQRENLVCTPGLRSFFKSRLFICLALLIIIPLVTYWPVFSHDFQMKWDDWWVVMNEYTEVGFYGENISAIITDFYHGQYAPVNQFYYLTLYTLFGYNPFWFHAAGLLVHIANVVLVFFLIRRLLQKSGDGFTPVSILRISFITAALMSLHPFLVEAVSWVSASKCIIYTFFYLLALHAYISYVASRKLSYFVLVLLCYLFSFGGKEHAVTLPFCLLLFDHTMKRNMRNWQVWVEKVPVFCITIGFVILTFYSQKFNGEGILSKQELHPW